MNQVIKVFPENWQVLEVFLSNDNQWNISPMGKITGLNFQQISASLQFLKIEPNKELFEGLKIIETTILKELSKKQNG